MATIHTPHHHTYEAALLNPVEDARRKLNWNKILLRIRGLGSDDKDAINELFALKIDTVQLNELSLPMLTFLYLLSRLSRDPAHFQAYFRDLYRERFDAHAASKPKNTVASVETVIGSLDEITSDLQVYINTDLPEDMRRLSGALSRVRTGCNDYGIQIGAEIVDLHTKISNKGHLQKANLAMQVDADVIAARIQLVGFKTRLETEWEDYEKSKGDKISKRPLHPSQVTMMVIQRIHEKGLGKASADAAKDAGGEFAHFCIAVSDKGKEVSGQWYTIAGDDFGYHLEQFPFVKELGSSAQITEHDVEHTFEKVAPEHVATLMAYLRAALDKDRHTDVRQMNHRHVAKARVLLHHLEELLARHIAAAMTESDATKASERAQSVTKKMLYDPLHRIDDDPAAAMGRLKQITPAHEAKEKGMLDKLGGVPGLADIAGIAHFVIEALEQVGLIKPHPKGNDKDSGKKDGDKGGGAAGGAHGGGHH